MTATIDDPNASMALTNHYVPPPTQAHPCPDCGRCPSCGRGGNSYPAWPYNPYYPWYDRPWWNQVSCTSGEVTTTTLGLGEVKGVSLNVQPSANAYLN